LGNDNKLGDGIGGFGNIRGQGRGGLTKIN